MSESGRGRGFLDWGEIPGPRGSSWPMSIVMQQVEGGSTPQSPHLIKQSEVSNAKHVRQPSASSSVGGDVLRKWMSNLNDNRVVAVVQLHMSHSFYAYQRRQRSLAF